MCPQDQSTNNPSIDPAAHKNQNFGPATFFSVPLHDYDSSSSICTSDDEAATSQHNSKQKFQTVPIHYPKNWWYRGKQLQNLTQMEHYALVDILPLSHGSDQVDDEQHDGDASAHENKSTNRNTDTMTQGLATTHGGGRPKRKAFHFHINHPLYHSHAQHLHAKQPTLIFNAHPPSHPGRPPQPPPHMSPPFILQTYREEVNCRLQKALKFEKFYNILSLSHDHLYGRVTSSRFPS